MENEKQISIDEVAKNNGTSTGKLWIILNGKVYDVTGYDHPGGVDIYMDNNTEDKYEEFKSIGHSKTANLVMNKLFIGNLKS